MTLSDRCKEEGENYMLEDPKVYSRCYQQFGKLYEFQFICSNHLYFEKTAATCVLVPGGGTALTRQPLDTCEKPEITLIKDDTIPQLYHICGNGDDVTASCFREEIFDDNLSKCVVNTKNDKNGLNIQYMSELITSVLNTKHRDDILTKPEILKNLPNDTILLYPDIQSREKVSNVDRSNEISSKANKTIDENLNEKSNSNGSEILNKRKTTRRNVLGKTTNGKNIKKSSDRENVNIDDKKSKIRLRKHDSEKLKKITIPSYSDMFKINLGE